MQYEDGSASCILDIIRIPIIQPEPHAYHTEDHLIDDGYYWKKIGTATWAQIESATDKTAGPLWRNGSSSRHGTNDKVPVLFANQMPGSLCLIKPNQLKLIVGSESKYDGGEVRKVRADFNFAGSGYNFVVTDPWIERRYFARKDGEYAIGDARLCISLAEPLNGNAIKLVASVITPERIDQNNA